MQAMSVKRTALILNSGTDVLSQLRFRNDDALNAFVAANNCERIDRDAGRNWKRANFELLARNVNGSASTPHTVIETLYVIRPISYGDYGGGTAPGGLELQRVGTITWNFQAGSGGEIPAAQLPTGSAFARLNAPLGGSLASSGLLENEAGSRIAVTPGTDAGPIAHVQDSGATIGYVRHFRGMNAALIEGVLPFSQLYNE